MVLPWNIGRVIAGCGVMGRTGGALEGMMGRRRGDGFAARLEIEAAALFREDELYAERVIGQQFLLNAFFLVAAGFAMGDDNGQSTEGGHAGECGQIREFLVEQCGREVTEKRFDGLFIGKRYFDEHGFQVPAFYQGGYGRPYLV